MTLAPGAADLPGLGLNPNARIEVLKIGNRQQPVFIVDQALTDAEAMVDFACTHGDFVPPAAVSRYPGLIARLPGNYVPALQAALRRPIEHLFAPAPGLNFTAYGFFGLATVPPADMEPDQIIPHADTAQPHTYASVHFLGGTDYGGTAFYRHKASGLEVVSADDADAYRMRETELEAHKGRPADELRTLYEEIAYVEPAFNRLIFYRANQLHSAKLATDILPDDPRTGRLTANLFVNPR